MGWGFPKHLAAQASCAGDVGKAEGLDPAARCTAANPSPGFLQNLVLADCWRQSGVGDLIWCVLQGRCCPHPVWQRGCTALALFLVLGWCVDAWPSAGVSPSRGVHLHPLWRQQLVVAFLSVLGPKGLIIRHGLQLLQNHWMWKVAPK